MASPHTTDEILDLLRAAGGRVTTGRRAIVGSLLAADDHHVTAEVLATMVQADHPDVHLSTVYRTLDALEGLGVVTRVDVGADRAVYHLTTRDHHHLVCDACGSITETDHDALAALADDLAERHGFTLSGGHLSLHGRCRTCGPASRADPPAAG